jgi:hypothetical protein
VCYGRLALQFTGPCLGPTAHQDAFHAHVMIGTRPRKRHQGDAPPLRKDTIYRGRTPLLPATAFEGLNRLNVG